ncbi:MAG TPA: hypothetical protein VFS05_09325 [Gemmatimonadaceae bacterium]|nr:hypothetical protein [Gemmatimonadaceae bacterium]
MAVGGLIFLLGMAIPITLIALALLADLAYAVWTLSRRVHDYGLVSRARRFTMARTWLRHRAATG